MKYIAISGTVGAGKTTLLRRLADRLGPRAAWHEERPDENPFIRDYYSDSRRWSFHSQVTFLSQYYDDIVPAQSGAEYYLFDRSLLENLIICRYRLNNGDLTADEYAVLEKLASGMARSFPPIDKYLYLECSALTVKDHMLQRGRDYEDDLDLFYVFEMKRLYDEWRKALPADRTMIIDMDTGCDLEEILSFIEA